jgi:molybdate transport system substrate-binding protein
MINDGGSVKSRLIRTIIVASFILFPLAAQAEEIQLFAAGSLRSALGDVAKAFEKATGNVVKTEFAPSGLLRQRIESGERTHVFASANMAHPKTLVNKGQTGPVVLFARNNLCALVQAGLPLASSNLLEIMLDPNVRLGTSTPKADPSGDYAWELFAKAEKRKPGAFDVLSRKALQLTGAENSPKTPPGRNPYAWVMQEDQADIFLTYCTNAVQACNEDTQLRIIQVPDDLAVGADYGLIVLNGSPVEAWRFAMFIIGPEGQKIMSDYGFVVGGLPANG